MTTSNGQPEGVEQSREKKPWQKFPSDHRLSKRTDWALEVVYNKLFYIQYLKKKERNKKLYFKENKYHF